MTTTYNKNGIRILDKPKFALVLDESKFVPHGHSKRSVSWNKTNGRCYYCDKKLQKKRPEQKKNYMTIDHIHPTSKGGNSIIKNIVPACHKCNSLKGDMTIDEFMERG